MKRFTIISLTIMMAAFSVSARPTGFRLGGGYAMDYYNSAIDTGFVQQTGDICLLYLSRHAAKLFLIRVKRISYTI